MIPTVLLVEDDEDDVFFMRRAFKDASIANPLSVVLDGREAIDYMSGNGKYVDRQTWQLPCLILLDLKLPRVLGLDVLRWIRSDEQFKSVIVVVLTSSKEDIDVERAYALGANSYLVKPPDAEKLLTTVKRIKEYWMDLNQLAPRCIEFGKGQASARPQLPSVADPTLQ